LGHFKNDCSKNKGAESGQEGCAPGICLRCRKGNHWAKVCKIEARYFGLSVARKREKGPAPGPDLLTENSLWGYKPAAQPKRSVFELVRTKPGGAGLDLCSTTHAVLTLEIGVQTLPTGVFGPLPVETCGFLLGRSSSIAKGLQIYPGVINNDYEGEIKIIAAFPHGVITVPANQKIVQLVLIPLHPPPSRFVKNERGQGGFDSSGVNWVQSITNQRPNLKLTFNGISFEGLIDNGADVTIIRGQNWPSTWPLTDTVTHFQGIGYPSNPK
jgi:dUTPase